MYCILHMIGSDAEREEQSALIAHLREAFHMDDGKHAQLSDIARWDGWTSCCHLCDQKLPVVSQM